MTPAPEKREIGDDRVLGTAIMNLANVGYSTGDFQTGLDHGLAAVDLFRKIGLTSRWPAALGNCGWYSLSLGNPARAEEFFNESMAVFGQLGAIRHVAATMRRLAATLVARHEEQHSCWAPRRPFARSLESASSTRKKRRSTSER